MKTEVIGLLIIKIIYNKYYFDSYGNATLPKQLAKYLGPEIYFIIVKDFKTVTIHQFAATCV